MDISVYCGGTTVTSHELVPAHQRAHNHSRFNRDDSAVSLSLAVLY